MIRYSGTDLQFCNGSSWQTLGVSGAGLTSLGGLTGSAQTFATGDAGTAPAITSGGTVHTLDIPLASAAGVTSGTISKTEYDIFNAKLGTATAFSGDVSGAYNATSVDKIKGTDVTITTLTSGEFLKYNGTAWVNSAIAISDVTNLSTQLADKIDASQMPANCGAGETLTFSSPTGTWVCSSITVASANITDGTITSTDLASSVADGLWTVATSDIYRASGNVGIGTTAPGAPLEIAGPSGIGQLIITPGTGAIGDTGFMIVNARAQFGYDGGLAAVVLSDAGGSKPVTIRSGNAERLRVTTTGNVGIGTSNPGAALDVSAATAANFRSLGTQALGTTSGGGNLMATTLVPSAADQRLGVMGDRKSVV
jgi:hypothetical protein